MLVIYCLVSAAEIIVDKSVTVYCSDTDVFMLLLNFCDMVPCKILFQKIAENFVNITEIHRKLGTDCCRALLSLYGITGCDTVGGFAGISKEFWFRRFLEHERDNEGLIQALCDIQQNASRSIRVQIEGLVCRAYLFPGQSQTWGNHTKSAIHDTDCLCKGSMKAKSYHQQRVL